MLQGAVLAALNLTPDAGLVLTQAGLFLTNLYVVKKLMLDPYLKLKDKRYQLTLGGQKEAQEASQDVAAKTKLIDSKIAEAMGQAKLFREERKAQAQAKQLEMVDGAKAESKKKVEAVGAQVSAALEEELKKIPALVKSTTDEMFSAVLR